MIETTPQNKHECCFDQKKNLWLVMLSGVEGGVEDGYRRPKPPYQNVEAEE
jgi:hypothetical protein